jgi:peptidoglycan hydrolase-like protein with peptidoglycan-binding domain
MMKIMLPKIIAAALFTLAVSAPAQEFRRSIEVQTPRMNGPDVQALQRRLLAAGFAGIGEADGYYGPATEKAVKQVQCFTGFEETGIVDRALWDFIFADAAGVLSLISVVSAYDTARLRTITGGNSYDYWNFSGYSFTVYFAGDGVMKVLEIQGGGGDSAYTERYYFAAEDRFVAIRQNSGLYGSSTGVYIRSQGFTDKRGYASEMGSRKADYESDFEPDGTLLAVLYSLRFGP